MNLRLCLTFTTSVCFQQQTPSLLSLPHQADPDLSTTLHPENECAVHVGGKEGDKNV